jgi:ligand-binding sensor domain-containing protein/serine phosphatase RsbU (regulator of sigma subunit)
MRKINLLFLFILVFANITYGQYINFKHYTTDQGLAQQFVYSITQNQNGFLYVGTGTGLSIYGGNKFDSYLIKDGLSDNFITSTYQDQRKTIWIGHFQNGISYHTNNHFGHIPNSILTTIKVNKIVGDNDGRVFALTSGIGVVQIVDTLVEKKLDIIDEVVFDAYIENDNYFLATPEGLKLYTLKNKQFIFNEFPSIFGQNKCSKIIKSNTSPNEYFCSIDGIGIIWFKYSKEKIRILKIFSPQILKSDALIKDFVFDNSNNIWVSCFGDGIRKVNCKNKDLRDYVSTTVINTSNGLPTNNIQCLFVDNQKNIWLGTYGEGLLQYVNEIFIEYKIYHEDAYGSLTTDRYDSIFVVTLNGLFKITDKTNTENLKPIVLNKGDRKIKYVTSINDTLFVTDEKKNSIFIYDVKEGKIKKELVFPKTNATVVSHICINASNLFVSTNQGLYVLTFDLKVVNFFNHENKLLRDLIYSSYYDSQDRLWIASHGTKPYWLDCKTGNINYFNDIEGMNLFNINGYVEDSRKNIWIATEGDGLFKYNNKNFVKISTREGLLSNYCYGINSDMKNNIWIGHRNGLSKIGVDEKIEVFGLSSQVKNINVIENGVLKDRSRHLWFIGTKSLFKHAIENQVPNKVAPKIVYLGAEVNDVFYSPVDTILDLPYGKYGIKFKFICISLANPGKIEFSYMLDGQDSKWLEAFGSNLADGANASAVSSGTYKFKVIAKNEDGFSTKEKILVRINIDKPIWLKWWFILFVIILLSILILLFIRLRTRQLIKNKKALEQTIYEQTIEIRSEKEYVTKINNELSAVYKDLKDSINYARNIQTSILPSFEDIKHRINVYNYLNPKDVVGGDFYGFYDLPNGNQVVFLADCTGHGVPGGFLTVIAKALLDKIVLQMKINDCNEIIQNLNIEFRLFFGSDTHKENINFEGLVITICYVDYHARIIKVCAAGTFIYYSKNNEIIRFKGNKSSVGYEEKLETLETLELPFDSKPRIYMFSDGIQDQFGGPVYKRYTGKRVTDSIKATKNLPLENQGEQVIKTWLAWKGTQEQIDDAAFIVFEVIQ